MHAHARTFVWSGFHQDSQAPQWKWAISRMHHENRNVSPSLGARHCHITSFSMPGKKRRDSGPFLDSYIWILLDPYVGVYMSVCQYAIPKISTTARRYGFYQPKRTSRYAGIPHYESNFAPRIVFYHSKPSLRNVGEFLIIK